MKALYTTLICIFFWASAIAQNEYRITEQGKYQYLSSREQAGMVYDESKGTYYKDITLRTFYLETYRRGYLPRQISYDEFTKLTKEEQRGLLNQPFDDLYDCSVDAPGPECLGYAEKVNAADESSKGIRVDLNPQCTEEDMKSKGKNPSLSSKLLMDPNNRNIENVDCSIYTKQPLIQSSATRDKNTPSTINLLLGK